MNKIFSVTGLAILSLSGSGYAIERLTPIKEPEIVPAKSNEVNSPAKAWLGVAGHPVSDALASQLNIPHGVTLELVAPDGSAAQAGIKKFDIITQIGDQPIKGMNDMRSAMREAAVDSVIDVTIFSEGKSELKKVKLAARPAHLANHKVVPHVAQPQSSGAQQKLPKSLQHLPASDRQRIEKMIANQVEQFEKHFAQMDVQTADGQAMQEKVQGMNIDLDDIRMKGHSNYSGTFTMMDDQGSIRLKVTDEDGKHVVVKDTEGKLLYAGPYETAEDKAAVPANVRERIEALGLNKKKHGVGFQFKFGQ